MVTAFEGLGKNTLLDNVCDNVCDEGIRIVPRLSVEFTSGAVVMALGSRSMEVLLSGNKMRKVEPRHNQPSLCSLVNTTKCFLHGLDIRGVLDAVVIPCSIDEVC